MDITCRFIISISLALCINTVSAASTSESNIETRYDGVIGSDVPGVTISSTGAAIQQSSNRAQTYLFFSQTLANQIYYEIRLYGAYNYATIKPLFTSATFTNSSTPLGYGSAAFIGYDFKPSAKLDLIPYLRLNLYKDMAQVYSDDQGDSIHSTTLGAYLGLKLAYKIHPHLTPTLNTWAGRQNIVLNGNFPGVSPGLSSNAILVQNLIATQLGLTVKISQSFSLAPYATISYLTNIPDNVAIKGYTAGGFNLRQQSNFQGAIGLKVSYSW